MPISVIITSRKSCAAALLAALLSITGCVGTGLPNWLNPGPTNYQVGQADSYDPYPDPTIGPAVVGGRPIGYLNPRANPDPAKIKPPSAGMAPVYPAAPPVTYPPPVAYPPAGAVSYPPVYAPAAQCPPPASVPVTSTATATPYPIASTNAGAFVPTATTRVPNVAASAGAPVAYGKAIGAP
ncbi:MAG TPA: hypothetical protein VGI75_05805 [Pirellulales bacterium]